MDRPSFRARDMSVVVDDAPGVIKESCFYVADNVDKEGYGLNDCCCDSYCPCDNGCQNR
jgi:hypothetical protein